MVDTNEGRDFRDGSGFSLFLPRGLEVYGDSHAKFVLVIHQETLIKLLSLYQVYFILEAVTIFEMLAYR